MALRWLGAPPTVLALIVLVLNDHVWKQQWPGPLTGKVSDVAGLLVAPPLLALLLAWCRPVRDPQRWGIAAVAVGFLVVKGTATGAAAFSAALSLVTPSMVRADATDLLALPVLWLAARTARWASAPALTRHHHRALAVGALLVPSAVLGTTATSPCGGHLSLSSVGAVAGRLTTTPAGWKDDLAMHLDYGLVTLHEGKLVTPAGSDLDRLLAMEDNYQDPIRTAQRSACSLAEPTRCWRLPTVGQVRVEGSTDGGRSWTTAWAPDRRYREDVVAELGERCGEKAVFDATDLAVADTADGPVVAVALRGAGLALGSPDGTWTRVPIDQKSPPPTLTTTVPPTPGLRPLVPLDPVPTRSPARTRPHRSTTTPHALPRTTHPTGSGHATSNRQDPS